MAQAEPLTWIRLGPHMPGEEGVYVKASELAAIVERRGDHELAADLRQIEDAPASERWSLLSPQGLTG